MPEGSIQKIIVIAGLILWLSIYAARPAEKQPWNPETPAGKRLKAAIEVINAGDMDSVETFIAHNFASKSIDFFGEKELFDIYFGMFEKYNGLDFHHIRESSAIKEVAVFRCRQTHTGYVFGVTVEPEPPHKIRGITILPLVDADEDREATALSDEDIAQRLSFILDRFEEGGVFSGVVLVARNGKTVLHHANGWANREESIPVDVDSRFNLASLTKMFTAVAIAQLCEQGKLSYEDPIGKYLGPDWIPIDIGQKVKIKHLLSHTSGIGGEDFNITYVEEAVARGFTQIEDGKVLTSNTELNFEPGDKFEYSNLGYQLLGAVVEKASGISYFAYVKSHIFEPAGMTGVVLSQGDVPESTLVVGYEKINESDSTVFVDNRSRIYRTATPAGMGYATANDLQQFARALRRNALISPETREILFAPKVELNSPRYGFGFRVRSFRDQRVVGHTGGYIGINNSFSIGLDDGLTVIILSNLDILTGTVCHDIGILIDQIVGRTLE